MVLDTSAVIAILRAEEGWERMVRAVIADRRRLIGTPTLVESAAVMLARHGGGGEIALDALLHRLQVEVVPLSRDGARLARLAYARFGRGIGSPGVLNYGDCLAYGVAMSEREPLLFKGDDFGHTDVAAVAY